MWKRNPYYGIKSGLFNGVGGFPHRQHRKQEINRGLRKKKIDYRKKLEELKNEELSSEIDEIKRRK